VVSVDFLRLLRTLPYRNRLALAACILAVVFGILGLKYARNHPNAKGGRHALIGLIMGALGIVAIVAFIGGASLLHWW
jgi:hypothetical protein